MQTFQTARLSCNQRKRKDHPVIVVDSPCPHLPSFHLQKTDVRSPATSENTKSGIYKAFQRHPFGLYVVSFSFYLSSYLHREVLSPGFNVCSKFFFFRFEAFTQLSFHQDNQKTPSKSTPPMCLVKGPTVQTDSYYLIEGVSPRAVET